MTKRISVLAVFCAFLMLFVFTGIHSFALSGTDAAVNENGSTVSDTSASSSETSTETDNILTEDGVDSPFLSSSEFVAACNAIEINGELKIKLGNDIKIEDKTLQIKLQEGSKLFIDLNGYTLSQVLPFNASSSKSLFLAAKNAELTIYSSCPGGAVFATRADSTGVKGKALVSAISCNGFKLNLGSYKDASGSNLTVTAPSIIDMTSTSDDTSEININGGTYIRYGKADDQSMFTLRASCSFTASNAIFYCKESGYIINDAKASYANVNAVFENSEIIQQNASHTVVNQISQNSVIVFKSTLIAGALPKGYSGKIFTYEECIITAETVTSDGFEISNYISENGKLLLPMEEKTSIIAISHYDIDVDTLNKSYTVSELPSEHIIEYKEAYKVTNVSDILSKDSKINLTTKCGFYINLFLPAEIAKAGTVYIDSERTNEVISEMKVYENTTYAFYSSPVSPASLETVTFYVVIKDALGEETVKEYKMSLSEYFKRVLARDEVTKAEINLVVNAANYCNELYKYVNGQDADEYNEILTAENKKLTELDMSMIQREAEKADLSEISTLISGISVYIDESGTPSFVIKKTLDYNLTITMHSFDTGSDVLYETKIIDNYYFISGECGIYDITADMTIEVEGKTGICNLAQYITEVNDEQARAVALAIYSYSLASKAYILE